jgi:hypothetical protein
MARKAKSKQVVEIVLNPFDSGVSYDYFLKTLPKGKTATEYLKHFCSEEQLKWLEIELKHFKNKK